jgi:sodium transport system permease protein
MTPSTGVPRPPRGVPWLIAAKELRETLRDRRTLAAMVLLPFVLYPLLGLFLVEYAGWQTRALQARRSRVAIESTLSAAVTAQLRASSTLDVRVLPPGVARPALLEAVRRRELDVALRTVGRGAAAGGNERLEAVFLSSQDDSALARQRVEEVLHRVATRLRDERLRLVHLTPADLAPVVADFYDVATREQSSTATLARLLPVLLVLTTLLGALYPAIDLTAGEKERGTLEPLLAAPVLQRNIVLGKFLAVATLASVSGLLNLASMSTSLALGLRGAGPAAALTIPWRAIPLAVLALVATALFFSALLLAVAALARSFKEAQNLLTPVYLACILPAAAASLPGVELRWTTAWVPGFGGALLLRELVRGTASLGPALLSLGTSCVAASVALWAAGRAYTSERILFREDRGPGSKPPRQHGSTAADRVGSLGWSMSELGRRPALPPASMFGLLALILGLILFVGAPLQRAHLFGGLTATQLFIIVLPGVMVLRFSGLPVARSLGLRLPRPMAVVGAVLLGASAWLLLLLLLVRIAPELPKEAEELARRLLGSDPNRPRWLTLAVLALVPAVCEETLFRGVVLPSLARAVPPAAAIALCGLLFGLFHLSIYRLPTTALLGMVSGWLAYRTRSLFPSMIFHGVNNGVAVVSALGHWLGRFTDTGSTQFTPPAWAIVAALVASAAGAALVRWDGKLAHRAQVR